jgi:GrpB-like predicted nucleotidyltransferase (UPF0157 family)
VAGVTVGDTIGAVPTHPLWREFNPAATLARRQCRVARRQSDVAGVVPFDHGWAADFDEIRMLLLTTLAHRAVQVSHVGSTAVPGLPAKPIVDVDLTVADSAVETDYLPGLEAAGFRLIAREPDWEEHRCLTLARPNANVHVFSPGAIEPKRHLLFRDWMIENQRDRDDYGKLKLGLASSGFAGATDYNGRKAAFVYDGYERAFAHDPRFEHQPRPRPAT